MAEEGFQSITVEEWQVCVDHIIKIENEYFAPGRTLYNDYDKLVIHLSKDSSSASEEAEIDKLNKAGVSGTVSVIEYLVSNSSN